MITIDGKLIFSFPLFNPMIFKDVKVFAGDNGTIPQSDVSYKNLEWENLPVPDILFGFYTPAIVSLEYRIKI